MKILVAYDDSAASTAAINDLPSAGLPDDADVVVLSIETGGEEDIVAASEHGGEPTAPIASARGETMTRLYRALSVATRGESRLRELFPAWTLRAEGRVAGSVVDSILEEIGVIDPDLVIVGSHRRSMLGRIVHGSVAHRLLAEATCSLRIGHTDRSWESGALRIVLGVDGSDVSMGAVAEVCRRRWPIGTAVRLIAATNAGLYGLVPGPNGSNVSLISELSVQEHHAMENAVSRARELVRDTELLVTTEVIQGDPASVLLGAADEWGADAIFLGAQGHEWLERTLLGSVSSSVVAHAKRAVEIVRPRA